MKWEYSVIATSGIEAITQNRLNEFGGEGWELVAVYDGFLYLKRPNTAALLAEMQMIHGDFVADKRRNDVGS